MTNEAAVPEVLTREIIISWPASVMLQKMKDPETRAEIERIFNTPETDPAAEAEAQRVADEAAAAEAASKAAEEAEVVRIAAEAAAAEAAAVVSVPVIKKLVVEYQATDPVTGSKIGRPTHLETTYIEGDKDSLIAAYQEMSEKQRIAHVNATQALEAVKKQKITLKEDPKPIDIGLSEAQIAEVSKDLDDDPEKAAKAAKAIRKLSNADAAEERERKAAMAEEAANAERASLQFMRAHLNDFNPCQANADLLTQFILDNNLAWTSDNLEVAFQAIESQLAPVSSPVVDAPVPVAPVETAVPTVEPVVVPPVAVTVPVAAANPPAPARRVPNGGVEPGTMQGRATVPAPQVGLTKKDILKMPRDEYRQKIKNPQFRALVEKIMAA